MTKTASITGITGQDRGYLAEWLLAKGMASRRASSFNTDRVDPRYQYPHEQNVWLTDDSTDATNIIRIIQLVQPKKFTTLQLSASSRSRSRRRTSTR